MIIDKQDQYIELRTSYDGDFKVTILSKNGAVLFCQNMRSHHKKIILKGFSLMEHSVTLSPKPLIF